MTSNSFVEDYDFYDGVVIKTSAPKRPRLCCECAIIIEKKQRSYVLRLSLDGEERLLFEIDSWWNSLTVIRPQREPVQIVPPIRSDLLRRAQGDRFWHQWFATALAESNASPLHAGRHWLTSVSQRRPSRGPFAPSLSPLSPLSRTFERGAFEPHHYGAVWPLREPSDKDSGRVKLWRKHARNGTLPPLLLLHVSPLESFVLLDGHDRLLAALLEKKTPQALALSHLRDVRAYMPALYAKWQAALAERLLVAKTERFSKATMDQWNYQHIYAYGGERYETRTRCWPMRAPKAALERLLQAAANAE